MATTDTTIHDDNGDFIYHHHNDKWSSPGVIIPIVAGVGLFIIVLFAIYALRRRRYFATYDGTPYPVAPRSEAPEPMSVEGRQSVDYEAGYVQEHYHRERDGNYSPGYGEQYFPHHDNAYGYSGMSPKASPKASPGAYGHGGYGRSP